MIVLAESKLRPADKIEFAKHKPRPTGRVNFAEYKPRPAGNLYWELLVAAIGCSAKDSGSDVYRGIAYVGNCQLQQLAAPLRFLLRFFTVA